MNKLPGIIAFIITGLIAGCTNSGKSTVTIENPRCEYLGEALIARQDPRFSWELSSPEAGQAQTAWQLVISDDPGLARAGKGNIRNSGKIMNNQTFGNRIPGKEFKSFSRYYWSVRIWDRDGKSSGWSEPSSFITGAFDRSEWKAMWIGDVPEKPLEYPHVYKHIGYMSSYAAGEGEEKWVTADLGTTVAIDTIKLYPAFENIRKIRDYYFPQSYRLEVSTDGQSWTTVREVHDSKLPGGAPVLIDAGHHEARYVKFTALRLRIYDFRVFDFEDQGDRSRMYAFSLAELEALSGGRVVSKGARVTYSDALIKIDREDGYDPDLLTDGITGTPPHPARRPIPPSPLLRKAFELKEKPARALAFVSALGDYELTVNGLKPDTRVLSPEWTDYNKRVQYQVYDLTERLSEGTNVIGAQLADGWYAGMLGPTRWSEYFPKRGAYGLDRRLFFQLEMVYPDGHSETLVSDPGWQIFRDGPVRMSDNFLGETYDARKEIPGWDTKSFDASGWDHVYAVSDSSRNLVPQVNQPVKIIETLEAKNISRTKTGKYLFDAGENIAGWCRLSLEGRPGDVLVLRHGEMLDEKGELYTENLGAAIQTDSLIIGPSGKVEWEPRFTYHGFRYAELGGLRGEPMPGTLKARVIASDQPRTGTFECSNPMLNQLWKNLNRSHISNMTGIPTDCPQRDERCGWMGDVYIFAQAAMFNRDMEAFFTKWMTDILDAQSERGTFPDIAPHPFAYEKHFTNAPGWADAAIKLPWLMYINYGDTEIIGRHFGAYEKYVNNIAKTNPDLIWRSGLGLNYGDWLNGNTLKAKGFPTTGAAIPSTAFSTIMFFNSAKTLSMMASVTGRKEKAEQYSALAGKIREAFIKTFTGSEGKIEGDAQACYALALNYGLFTPGLEKTFEKRMIDKFIPYDGRMNTGFHSTICLMKELAGRGYLARAYGMLETSEFPSWGYSIGQGATSIWERWDAYVKGRGFQDAGMNSFNHYAFGAIGEWMFENILGISPDTLAPGYRHFILKPRPGGTLTSASGSYHSICGKIETAWKKEGGTFEYSFTIPANTTATVYIPSRGTETVMLNDRKAGDLPGSFMVKSSEGFTSMELGPGIWKAVSQPGD